MIRIKAVYAALAVVVLMAVGCAAKGWRWGAVFWGILALLCLGRILRSILRERKPRK